MLTTLTAVLLQLPTPNVAWQGVGGGATGALLAASTPKGFSP